MLPSKSIKAFISTPRDDLRSWKKKPPEKLDVLKSRLRAPVPEWDKFRLHQKVGFLLGVLKRKMAFWFDTGTGKTFMSTGIALYLRRRKVVSRVLVLVSNNVNRYEWRREIKKHSPDTKTLVLSGSTIRKWEKLENSSAFIVIATYHGLMTMVCPKKVQKKGRHKGKVKMKINRPLMSRIINTFDGIIMDESTECSNAKKLPFYICRRITNHTKMTIALSGTPFDQKKGKGDPTPLWSQMFLVDQGASLGRNLALFRGAMFKEKPQAFSAFPAYEFDPKKTPLLRRLMAHRSLSYKASAADLPKVVAITKVVRLSMDARTYYKKAREALIAAKGNHKEVGNLFLRMRQISSGFLGYADDELGVRAQFEFPNNPKLELLLSLIQSCYIDHKILVSHEFVFSGSIIGRELDRLKIKWVRIYGKTKNHDTILRQFDEDDETRVIILNKAGAKGLNLQAASYHFIFERLVSGLLQLQMERRVERQESKHDKVFRYDLIVAGTVDEKLKQYQQDGRDLFNAVMKGSETL